MSTLDEITKEKQRVSEALARVDAQREKVASQLAELEATERVLARYSKSVPTRRTSSPRPPAPQRRALQPSPVDRAGWRQNRMLGGEPRRASAIRSLLWQTAGRGRKSPRHAKGYSKKVRGR